MCNSILHFISNLTFYAIGAIIRLYCSFLRRNFMSKNRIILLILVLVLSISVTTTVFAGPQQYVCCNNPNVVLHYSQMGLCSDHGYYYESCAVHDCTPSGYERVYENYCTNCYESTYSHTVTVNY